MKTNALRSRTYIKICFVFILGLFPMISFALPFNIVPVGTLPTSVYIGTTVAAAYTVTNNTQSQRNNNYVKYLPTNVTVASGGCGPVFNLAPKGQVGDSCVLNLLISGTINGNNPNPQQHLFVCFPGGITCAGTYFPLNVSAQNEFTRAYITNDFATGANNVSVCSLDANGDLIDCTTSGNGLSNPHDMDFNAAKTLAYILNAGSYVSKCMLDANGSLINCANASVNQTFSFAVGITINPANTLAYVTNGDVSKCILDVNGDLTACAATGSGFNTPERLYINASATYAYVTDVFTNLVSKCQIAANGDLTACTTSGNGLTLPGGLIINSAGTFAYIANTGANNVSKCSITAEGDLTTCTTSGSGLNFPEGITMNAAETFIYVTNAGDDTISKCSLTSSGDLINCTNLTGGFSGPTSIVLK